MKALDFHNSFTLIKQILDEEEFNLSFSNRSSELQFSTFRSEDFRFQRNYGDCCHRSR